jgi:hypothetical protein
MTMANLKLRWLVLIFQLVLAAAILTGCSLPRRSQPTPTLDLTQVYGTLAVMATTQPIPASSQTGGTASPMPFTPTPAQPSETPRTSLAANTTLPTQPVPCDQAAAGLPIDVTIPDDTLMEPGEAFTKIWRLQNVGSCTWTLYYSAAFFYGDRMDAPPIVPFSQAVPPGSEVEIAVEMVAPLTPGTYQGNWKLSNAEGVLFGIGPNGDAPFWVRIIVSATLPGTPTITPSLTLVPAVSPSPTPSPTATPPVQVSDTLTLSPLDLIDLDTLELQPQDADLVYQTGADNYHFFMPMESVLLGVYGSLEPGLHDCQNAGMSSAPIAVESLSIDTYLCYRTDLGAAGRARLVAMDPNNFSLTLDLLTWELP